MAEYADREHFIPLRKADLIELLCQDPMLNEQERSEFRQLCKLLGATFHYEYNDRLESLKGNYAPFDPDADTEEIAPLPPEVKQQRLDGLFKEFQWILERANFELLAHDEIQKALHSASDWGLNLNVDFSVFDRLEIFARGDTTITRKRRRLRTWFKEEDVTIPVFQRLVVMLRLRPHRKLPKNIDTDHVYIKLFKEIPKMDLEMLLPGTQVKMTLADRSKIGLPLATGIGITGYKMAGMYATILGLITGAITTSSTIALLTLAGGTIGYGIRSFYGYQQTKTRYQLTLTESLYFQNLASNGGVLFRLLDEAEEQEFREAILAYYFLWRFAGDQGWTEDELDQRIEEYLLKTANLKVDFEIADAMEKVVRLGLVEQLPDSRRRAIPIGQALQKLDHAWDNYFHYNVPSAC